MAVNSDSHIEVSKEFTAVTIGDINMDYVADISNLDFPLSMELSGQFPRPIQTLVGGNGVFFAEAAQDAGFSPSYLLASVGMDKHHIDTPDVDAQKAIASLNHTGIVPILTFDEERPTGRVIILYQPNDRRFTIADRGANAGFTIGRMPEVNDQLFEQTNLLYVSGYYLLEEQQREAATHLMKKFRNGGAFIMVDIVPHDVFTQVSLDSFKEYTSLAHAVSVEASTMFGFIGIGWDVRPNAENQDQLVSVLLDAYELCIIRLNSRSDFIIADRQVRKEVYIPYHDRVASLRFTDRILASALFDYLSNNCSISNNDKWINRAQRMTSAKK